ncbi:hypothetical protein ABFS82_06G032500 [Erythranthe guttata]|uniref:U-box domain-containing protein 32 isoform X1 n=2 Tax=Erythranthe guttata TaxID=4155 RepID=UPI00064DA8C8|nr:PREDICTED: U-box domain-containing protein 32 isoform X1 [Erythranthe guttata]|eukprot:XP_012852122.1 PREDICTED: U-box domain-containing protein 32 isoform X1 [Erythranthe guttata]
MGSDGETSDFSSPTYVAVGSNVKEGKSLLTWAVENFQGRDICLVHVHQPANFVSLLSGKLSTSKLKTQVIKGCQELERSKMQKLMNQYLLFVSQMGKQADKVCIEMKNIEKGILQLIIQHGIRRLVMGAAVGTFNGKKLSETNSSKAMVVYQQAPLSCHIWFISKGCLIYERPVRFDSHSTTAVALLPSTNSGGTTLTHDPKESMDVYTENIQHFEHPTSSTDKVVREMNPIVRSMSQTSGDDSPLDLNMEYLEHLSYSSSNTSPDLFRRKEIGDPSNKLEGTMMDHENSKRRAFENSLKQWRAEVDELEAVYEAETEVSLSKDEINRCEEVDELLLIQRQEIEAIKDQIAQLLKDLQLIQDQKPALESQLRESNCSEKELEDKILQAVNLLVTFKGTRDKLQIEYDSAVRKVNRYRALQSDDHSGISDTQNFAISFFDISEATQNFAPSQKIGEGRHGSVFKGMLWHNKVAIKMLPSSGSQSDSEFKNEMEVLCRVRHPNLVTLIGACPESRSLVYEYIGNGSLEDYLSSPSKTCSLSWQTRIRIAIDICSALLFLHANYTCSVHGNLKPSNVLLDANFVTKISDFGIFNLISDNENPFRSNTLCNKNDPETLAYMDPESFEYGEITAESDVYSFGVLMLRLLTAKPATDLVREVKCALERGNLETILDKSAGDWPLGPAKQFADVALMCCRKNSLDRPDLESEVWTVLEPMAELCSSSSSVDSTTQHNVPSYFLCPIFQEIMKDPHVAADGFTYEEDAIKGWFNSGHKTSPMTNLKLENCDLLPNYALYYAIQEWHQNA